MQQNTWNNDLAFGLNLSRQSVKIGSNSKRIRSKATLKTQATHKTLVSCASYSRTPEQLGKRTPPLCVYDTVSATILEKITPSVHPIPFVSLYFIHARRINILCTTATSAKRGTSRKCSNAAGTLVASGTYKKGMFQATYL